MLSRIKNALKFYLLNWWVSPALVLILLGILLLNGMVLHVYLADYFLLPALLAAFVGILIASIYQFVKGRKGHGVLCLLSLPLTGFAIMSVIAHLVLNALFNEEPDDFGKDIVIPANMTVIEPLDKFEEIQKVEDNLTSGLIAAFSPTATNGLNQKISTAFPALMEFDTTNRNRLIKHLSSSPKWFVTNENGKPYAYRRLAIGGSFENSLNGYWSSFTEKHCQIRVIIGFDGPVFSDPFNKYRKVTATAVNSGDILVKVSEDEHGQGKESYLVLNSGRAAIEIFEQTRFDDRRATLLALADLKKELEEVLAGKENENGKAFAVKMDSPQIVLAKGMQGGIYHVQAWVNPGAEGMVYLKAFEATKNTPLSTTRLTARSTAKIGWSKERSEKFRYQSEVTIYEGDWGNHYPARFELWFIPDSGLPERKLVEEVFKIEGWQR